MKLNHNLVLQRYLLHLFGCSDFEGLAQYLRLSHLEGYDENNVSHFHLALKQRNLNSSHLTSDLLLEYDENIYRHTQAISEYRDGSISWKYFQYLTLLFIEIYLDRYFSDSQALLKDLNHFIDRFNDATDRDIPNAHQFQSEYFILQDLNKVAIWSATGSGKTLLLHVNIKQYEHYAKKYKKNNLNKTLLITPNEGLSNQHLKEFKQSRIQAEIFSQNSGGFFSGSIVEILEISKLGEDTLEKTVAVDSFESNNLVLIDEGHRGAAGDVVKSRRDQLSENGFAFEYSATFGQAICAASGPKKKLLLKEYSKAILFDYSYKYFYKDGYGKDYRILNIKDDSNEDYNRKYLTACLLGYYQQLIIFEENPSDMKHYNIEKPLWIFVGGRVTKSISTKDASDVISIIKFISEFIKDSNTSKSHIKQIINGTAGLNDEQGYSIFANTFTYLKSKNISEAQLYSNILKHVFNTTHIGANVHLDNLKGIDGELGLRIGDTAEYFGVINVGDEGKLHKLCLEHDILGMEKEFSESLFHSINDKVSSINLLIGSRKFTEGWSSWRVSTMGLMNIGKGEGSQIIQLFGRGVRLKGHNMSLKRSSSLDEFQKPKNPIPKSLSVLETLNIFGIKADYMQQFKDYLAEEDLPQNENNFIEIIIPTTKKFKEIKTPLKVIQTQKGVSENYKKQNLIQLEHNEKSQHFNIHLDWYPKIQFQASKKNQSPVDENKDLGLKLQSPHLAFINWDTVYFELQKYKNERSWYNLAITKSHLMNIMNKNDWYDISIPKTDLQVSSFKKTFMWQEMAISLLKSYVEKFYLSIKNEYLAKHIELTNLDEYDSNFIDEYSIKVEENNEDIIENLKQFKELISKGHIEEDFQIHKDTFTGFDYEQHLYSPLLYMNGTKYGNEIKIKPQQLNEGEEEFIHDLKIYYNANKSHLKDREIYVLRNQSRSGIGFLAETKNFYPDFIIWQVIDAKQYISFIDPKGLMMIRDIWNHPKVLLHKTIKEEFETKLNDKNVTLSSFIISNTPFHQIQYRGKTEEKLSDYHNMNIFFQHEDRDTYIGKLLEKAREYEH